MTQDPNPRPSSGTAMPPVDKVIHDIRESEGHLRSAEAIEPVTGARPASPSDEAPGTQPPTRPGTAVGVAAAESGHEPAGHAPGHPVVAPQAAVSQHGASGHADPATDGHGHASGEELGPVDTANWGAGILGALVGLGIVACFAIATQGLGAY